MGTLETRADVTVVVQDHSGRVVTAGSDAPAADMPLQEMRTEMERVEDVMEYPEDPGLKTSPAEGSAISKLGGNVELKDVTFPSTYYAFTASYGMLSGAFQSLAGIALSAAQIQPILEMAEPFLITEPESRDGLEIVTGISGGVELDHVSFRYSEDMPDEIDLGNITVGKRFFKDLAGYDVRDDIPNFNKPVVIIQGSEDDLVLPEVAQQASQLYPDCEYHVIEGAEHGFSDQYLTQAAIYALRFLQKHT